MRDHDEVPNAEKTTFFSAKTLSLRGLQLFSLLAATFAVLGGGTFVLQGLDGLARVVGVEHAELATLVQDTAVTIEGEARTAFDQYYRALGWYWLMTGVMLFWIVPKIQFRTAWFRFIHVGFMAVGVANLLSLAEYGTSMHNQYASLIPEFGVPAIAIFWQWRVARNASADESAVQIPGAANARDHDRLLRGQSPS